MQRVMLLEMKGVQDKVNLSCAIRQARMCVQSVHLYTVCSRLDTGQIVFKAVISSLT